jgi:hypothetical protein
VLVATYDNITGNGSGILSSLAAPNGSSLVGFEQTGTDAVPTTVEEELQTIRITPQQFGAVGDGATDDTQALNDAIAAVIASTEPAVLVGYGTYRITNTVNFRFIRVDFDRATIDVAHAGIGILIGGNANSSNNPLQRYGTISRSVGTDSITTPTVRAIGVKGQHIHFQRAPYFQIYANTDPAVATTDSSSAYSSFWLKFVDVLELTNNPASTGSVVQWINENQFFLNRCREIDISGTYSHNHNQFWAGTLESATNWNWDTGSSNTVWCARFESGPTITLGPETAYNKIVQTWTSSAADWRSEGLSATVIDNGIGNIFVKQDSLDRNTHIVASNTIDNNVCLDTQSIYPNQVPSLAVVKASSVGILLETTLFPVFKNDILGFYSTPVDTTTDSDYRCSVFFYDVNKQSLTPVIGTDPTIANYASSVMTSISGNAASLGTGRPDASLILLTDDVAYVKIRVTASSGSQLQNQYADNIFAFVRRTNYKREASLQNAEINRGLYIGSPMPVTAVPTQGYAPLGFEAVNVNGLARYIVTRSVDTILVSNETAGSTTIDVLDVAGVQVGDIVGVQNDNVYVTDWTTVASISGITVTLNAGLTGDSAFTNRVVFVKWTTVTY